VTPRKRHEVSTSNPIEGCQSAAIAVQLVSRSLAEVRPHLVTEDCVRIHHPFLLVEEFECSWDGIDEGGVHVDDVIAHFEENRVRYFCSRTIVVIVADTTVSSTINSREKSRFILFYYSYSRPLREVLCFRKTPYFS